MGIKTFAIMGAAFGLMLAGAVHAAETEWNQEKATELATQFEQAASSLYQKAKVESSREPGQTQSADIYLVVDDVKTLRRHSRALSRNLAKGAGRDDTARLFSRVMLIVRDIREQRASTPVLEDSQDEIAAARDLLEKLAGFYGETLPPVAAPAR